jgi:hypothetical protein
MGNSKVNDICKTKQNKKGPAGKRAKPSNGKGPKKTSGEATPVVMPDDLDDYKGARKKLRHAVKAVVKANSKTLAEKIVGKAQDGDARGTQMMLSLIEKKKAAKEGKKKKRDGPSWAELLVSEPEWDDEEDGTANGAKASSQVSKLASQQEEPRH